jgi:hypothetical protein
MSPDPDDEILIELNRIGGAMEVRAVSALDGLEVAFTAPSSAANADIDRLARATLSFVRRKAKAMREPGPDERGGGGLIA